MVGRVVDGDARAGVLSCVCEGRTVVGDSVEVGFEAGCDRRRAN
jgi:hypothetical protein